MTRKTSLLKVARGTLRRCGLLALLLSGLVTSRAQALPPAQADWKNIKTPPLHNINQPTPVRVQLENGATIFLLPDSELPIVNIAVTVRGGQREEPADKLGLVSLYEQAWRTGGTKTRTGDQLDDLLALRAASIESNADQNSVNLEAQSLKGDFDEILKLTMEVLREPEFREDKLELARKQLYTEISRRNDDPMGIVGRESTKLALGPQHPYARHPEYTTVASVTRQDLLSWHQRYVQPQNLLIGVQGDFDAKAMEQKLRGLLGAWPKGPTPKAPLPAYTPTKPGLFFIAKDDVNQSNIHLVQLGTTRRNPDHYAIAVMNEILGGGFAARLFSNVRSKKGLAYSVRGGVGIGDEVPNIYRLSVGTASNNTAKALEALYEEVNGMLKNPPTEAELQKAKEGILNSFVFKLDTSEKVLSDQMRLEFAGYPLDYTKTYADQIRKVTLAEVNRVAKQYLNPTGFAVLVVGNPAELGAPISALTTAAPGLGPVQTVDITIPPPPAAAAPKTPGK